MLNHPDPQIQYIFTTLENQRDNLMVENGNLLAQLKALTPEPVVEVSAEPPAEVSEAVEETPAN